jgi:general secretion pathway protein F/type IV pilus assembly protein PilC
MPEFTYTARTLAGEKVNGSLSAATQREALSQLAQRQLFPLDVRQGKAARMGLGGRRISKQLLATTYGQLADLLHSGVPLLRSLKVLLRQTKQASLQEILARITDDVEQGSSLAEAMARHPRTFDDLTISIVRAGGEGGFLEEALEQVAQFTEKQEELKSRTMGAIAYPIFLCIVGTIVVSCLMIFLVPYFEPLFERLRERGELPGITEWLLFFSHIMQSYGLFILVGLIALGIWLNRTLATESGRLVADRIKIKLPLVGRVFLQLAVGRFCRILGTLLKNGVPIIKSLQIASDSTGNKVLAGSVLAAAENVSQGDSLAQPLGASGHFPISVVEMIAVAEESNSLEKVLVDVADGLDRRTWRQLDLAVRLLEPLLLLLLAGAVLMIVLALLLPVVKMSGAV